MKELLESSEQGLEESGENLEPQSEGMEEKLDRNLNKAKGYACEAGSKIADGVGTGTALVGGTASGLLGWYPGVALADSSEVYHSLPDEAQLATLAGVGAASYVTSAAATGGTVFGSYAAGEKLDEKAEEYFEKAETDYEFE